MRATGASNAQLLTPSSKPTGLIFGETIETIMTDIRQQPPRKTTWSARRLTLLCSAAALGAALALGGPPGYGGLAEQAFAATPAPQTVTAPGQVGFADLVAKVKPAVI